MCNSITIHTYSPLASPPGSLCSFFPLLNVLQTFPLPLGFLSLLVRRQLLRVLPLLDPRLTLLEGSHLLLLEDQLVLDLNRV